MSNQRSHERRRDRAHHRPRVRRVDAEHWAWECACGGASCRTRLDPVPWRAIIVEALRHSELVA